MPREVLEFLFCDKKKLKKKRKEKEKEESIYDIPVAGIINSTLFDCFDNKHFIHKVNFSTDFFFFFPLINTQILFPAEDPLLTLITCRFQLKITIYFKN
jgi:hypothetical protein